MRRVMRVGEWMGIRSRNIMLFAATTLVVVTTSRASAETLHQALASAYQTNPTILAERKRLEATDEQVPQAKSGYRPRVTVSGDTSLERTRTRTRLNAGTTPSLNRSGNPGGYQIEFTQNLFRGFRTANQIRQAEANVLAARETLRATEQRVLLEAVTAYMDVIRDRDIVRLRENDVRVLAEDVRGTTIRFQAGDATRTDVAQARARRARSLAALDRAKSNLRGSISEYVRVIGHQPGRLRATQAPQRLLPKSINGVVEVAVGEAPEVVQAAFQELAARHQVDVIRGELLPTVSLQGSFDSRYDVSSSVKQNDDASITGRVNIPLYQGGEVYSRIRAAKRTRESAARQIEVARTFAKARAVRAWSELTASRAQLRSNQQEVRASRTALAGVRAEEKVGQRTLLDVLDAKQELLEAQSALFTTRRDIVVAAYTVLSAMGRLTASDTKLGVELHDPEVHYGRVSDKFWGATVTPNESYEGYVLFGRVSQ